MRACFVAMAGALAISLIGPPAFAATLFTPVVEGGNSCNVVNAGSKERLVTVAVMNFNGTIASQSTVTIFPGIVYGLGATPTLQAYCRIDVKGPKSSIRASFCRNQSGVCVGGVVEAH